jgi:hypothetical protein
MMATREEPLTIESESDEGLLALLTRAERAVLTASDDPVGVIGIEPIADEGEPELFIEAAYAERTGRGVVERLDVRVRQQLEQSPGDALLREALAEFGGTAFTNICLSPSGGDELVDFTLHFGSKFRFWSSHTALFAEGMNEAERGHVVAVLGELGVRARANGRTLRAPRHALRAPLTIEAQLAAFRAAERAGLRVELYAATLPVARSVRLTLAPEPCELGCTLSRRLLPERSSIASDAVAIRDFVAKHFGIDLGGKSYRVENAHGDRADHRTHGPMGERKSTQWSLNWGARRK